MQLKQIPADFRVRELLEYTSDDDGPFFVHRLRKEKIDTLQAISILARAGQVDRGAIAFAGLKDRQGVTQQFLTIKGKRVDYRGQGIEVKFVGRAREALTSKMSQGNHFDIVVRDLHIREAELLQQGVERLGKTGYANYFDDQRFGCLRHGQGFVMLDVLKGRYEDALRGLIAVPSPIAITGDVKHKELLQEHWGDWDRCRAFSRGPIFERLFSLLQRDRNNFRGALELLPVRQKLIHAYAYQSHLWNRSLSRFLERKLPRTNQSTIHTIAGDYTGWGRLDDELRDELRRTKTPLTGPHGDGGHEDFRAQVEQVLIDEGLELSALEQHALPGFALKEEPRPAVVIPRELKISEVERDEENPGFHKVKLSFSLPRGAYATMWIKSLMANQRDHRRGGSRPQGQQYRAPRYDSGREQTSSYDGGRSQNEGYRGRSERDQGGYRGRSEGEGGGYRGRSEGEGGGYRGRSERDQGGYRGRSEGEGGGYRGRSERDQGGYRGRSEGEGGGYRGRSERDQGGYRGRSERDQGGYRGRSEGEGGGYRGRSERDQGGYRGRSEGEGGGYRGRSERDQGGYRGRSEGEGGGYRGRSERDQGGYRGRSEGEGGGYRGRSDGDGERGRTDRDSGSYRGRDERDRKRPSDEEYRPAPKVTQRREDGSLSVTDLDDRYRRAWKNLGKGKGKGKGKGEGESKSEASDSSES